MSGFLFSDHVLISNFSESLITLLYEIFLYFFHFTFSTTTFCQFIPNNTNYNQDIVGKCLPMVHQAKNRGIVDSDGNWLLYLCRQICQNT